jgi:hypothetical protein
MRRKVTQQVVDFLNDARNWLGLVAILALAIAFSVIQRYSLAYSQDEMLLVGGYIALQVIGWTALIEWLRLRS